jgi:chromosomal replication initiator protein
MKKNNLGTYDADDKNTILAIQRAVANRFGISVSDLVGKGSTRAIVVPRQIAMYVAKQLTHASLPEIGKQFGGKHHTTVMHSIAKVSEQRKTDRVLQSIIDSLLETCGVGSALD